MYNVYIYIYIHISTDRYTFFHILMYMYIYIYIYLYIHIILYVICIHFILAFVGGLLGPHHKTFPLLDSHATTIH